MHKKALGRGLNSLIPPHPDLSVSDSDVVAEIEVRDVRANPFQPRRQFDLAKLEELADSIREHGIIQPLIVRRSSIRGFEIVAGERRFRAAKLVGMVTVPAVVREFSDIELMEIALIENLQREDLNAIEIADAYAGLMEKCGLTQEELAKRVGQSRSHVANMLRLLNLPSEIRDYVSRGTISMGHARALLAVDDKGRQVQLADKVVHEELSVRKLESLIYQQPKTVSRETGSPSTPEGLHLKQYENQLRGYFGTSVRIHHGKKRGKIEIDYFSKEDLERILQLFPENIVQQ